LVHFVGAGGAARRCDDHHDRKGQGRREGGGADRQVGGGKRGREVLGDGLHPETNLGDEKRHTGRRKGYGFHIAPVPKIGEHEDREDHEGRYESCHPVSELSRHPGLRKIRYDASAAERPSIAACHACSRRAHVSAEDYSDVGRDGSDYGEGQKYLTETKRGQGDTKTCRSSYERNKLTRTL